MSKIWSRIEDVIDDYATGTSLQLLENNTLIFTDSQVYNMLSDLYDDFCFRHRDTIPPTTAFLTQYTSYAGNVGYNYFRMYDALQREYNPIYNYEMTESGADGRKVSTHSTFENGNTVSGNAKASITENENPVTNTSTNQKRGTITTTQGGGEIITDNGSEQNDHYVNAFDSGISDEGTHSERNVTTYDGRTHTTEFNDRTEVMTYGDDVIDTTNEQQGAKQRTENFATVSDTYDVKDYADDTTTTLNGSFNTVQKDIKGNEVVENYGNDVSLYFTKQNPDGTGSDVATGSDFADGTMHSFTRAGNIGVTTNAQMIEGELALRLKNLLDMYIRDFAAQYLSYIGKEC